MKRISPQLALLLAAILVIPIGCNRKKPGIFSAQEPPIDATLTSNDGRALEVHILGRENDQVLFQKKSEIEDPSVATAKTYRYDIDKLNPKSQRIARKLKNGVVAEAHKKEPAYVRSLKAEIADTEHDISELSRQMDRLGSKDSRKFERLQDEILKKKDEIAKINQKIKDYKWQHKID